MATYQSTHTGAEIDAGIDLLDKNNATEGQVLTADGTGGATWQNASDKGFYAYLYTYNDVKYFKNYTLTKPVKIQALLTTNSQLDVIEGQVAFSMNGVYNFFLADDVSDSTLLSIGTALPIVEDSNLRIILPNFASFNYNNHYIGCEFNVTTGRLTDAVMFPSYFDSFKNSSGSVIVPTITALTN